MFTYHDETTAPANSLPILQKVKAALGFAPNLHRVLAEAPAAYSTYVTLYETATSNSSLSAIEAQIVMMTSNVWNRCHYCTASHVMLLTMMEAPADIIEAFRDNRPIADTRQQALREFTENLLAERGHIGDAQLRSFLDAGYTKQQALDVLVALSAKLISNFTNALTHTEVDQSIKAYQWA
ncbi:MAG: carboxymuconolactone decarboxylase family protein [Sphingomonas sp.]|jgi:uncharacterized peroxidase-related enzyme